MFILWRKIVKPLFYASYNCSDYLRKCYKFMYLKGYFVELLK